MVRSNDEEREYASDVLAVEKREGEVRAPVLRRRKLPRVREHVRGVTAVAPAGGAVNPGCGR